MAGHDLQQDAIGTVHSVTFVPGMLRVRQLCTLHMPAIRLAIYVQKLAVDSFISLTTKKKLKSWFSASQILTHLRWRRRQHGLMAELVEGIICRRTLSNYIFGHKTHLPRFKEIYISNPINPFNKQREGVWVSGTQNSQKPPKI